MRRGFWRGTCFSTNRDRFRRPKKTRGSPSPFTALFGSICGVEVRFKRNPTTPRNVRSLTVFNSVMEHLLIKNPTREYSRTTARSFSRCISSKECALGRLTPENQLCQADPSIQTLHVNPALREPVECLKTRLELIESYLAPLEPLTRCG